MREASRTGDPHNDCVDIFFILCRWLQHDILTQLKQSPLPCTQGMFSPCRKRQFPSCLNRDELSAKVDASTYGGLVLLALGGNAGPRIATLTVVRLRL